MNVVFAVLSLAAVVAVALIVLLSFGWSRNLVGLGGVQPTGAAGWIAAKTATKAA